jgi:hypothetical protein
VNGNQSDNSARASGAAYVFVRSGTDWSQQAYLKASNTGTMFAQFGFAVGISDDTIVVGALDEASNATGINGNQSDTSYGAAGAAYVFTRNGTNWMQQAYLKASNTFANDFFSQSLSISGNTVAIGAPYEDSNAIGVNGNQSDNSISGAGAVYVFIGLGIGPRVGLTPDGSGGWFIRFTGAPYVSYRVQRAASMDGSWDTLSTLTAPATGLLEFHDTNAPSAQAFYRTVQP